MVVSSLRTCRGRVRGPRPGPGTVRGATGGFEISLRHISRVGDAGIAQGHVSSAGRLVVGPAMTRSYMQTASVRPWRSMQSPDGRRRVRKLWPAGSGQHAVQRTLLLHRQTHQEDACICFAYEDDSVTSRVPQIVSVRSECDCGTVPQRRRPTRAAHHPRTPRGDCRFRSKERLRMQDDDMIMSN